MNSAMNATLILTTLHRALMMPIILLSIAGNLAIASEVPLKYEACIATTLDKAIGSILDYGSYSKLERATLYVKDCKNCIGIPGAETVLGNKAMLKMLFSATDRFSREGWNSSAHVATVLWPAPDRLTDLSSKEFFPRFFLNCDSKKISDQAFQLVCKQDQTALKKYTYAISRFDSLLKLSTNSGRCKDGRVLLEFGLNISTNDQEVAKVKEAVAGGFPSMFIDRVFNEDQFFKMYFKNFYDGWVSSL